MKRIQNRPSGNADKKTGGVGMPAFLFLQQFGDVIFAAFGEIPYHVGSSVFGHVWRDVDVRVMLSKEQYEAMGFGDPKDQHQSLRWVAFVQAFSLLGQEMTGLPIDFQIQETDAANLEFKGDRSALISGCMLRQKREKALSA